MKESKACAHEKSETPEKEKMEEKLYREFKRGGKRKAARKVGR